MFESDKTWLEKLPGMTPWDDGCAELDEKLGAWLDAYSLEVCDQPLDKKDDVRISYLKRLWSCLGWHWRDANKAEQTKAKAETVGESLQARRGFQKGGKLGGDPMRDVVLAAAMLAYHNRALILFEEEYYTLSCAVAAKVDPKLVRGAIQAKGSVEWWNELLEKLIGLAHSQGKLEFFDGRCSLAYWLGIVVRRFHISKKRKKNPFSYEEIDEMAHTKPDATTEVIANESLRCFIKVLARALPELHNDDNFLLRSFFLENMKQKDIAKILGIHPGNVTRRIQRALERLYVLVKQHAADEFGEMAAEDMLGEILKNERTFANALLEAFAEIREDRS